MNRTTLSNAGHLCARPSPPPPLVRGIFKLLAVYALACLIVVSMEFVRVAIEGIALADYLPDLKGRAFFTITPLLALVLLFFWCLTGRLSAAALLGTSGAFSLLLAHLKKLEVLEKPLVSGDFTQIREALGVLDAVLAGEGRQVCLIAFALLIAALGFALLLARPARWPLPAWFRLCFALAFVGAVAWEVHHPWLKHLFALQKIGIVGWNYDLNLRRNGLLLSLLLDARQVIYRPADYSREAVEAALGDVPRPQGAPLSAGAHERPDIILYLGESFWDVAQLDVHFSRDPVPNFRRTIGAPGFVHGTMLSPSFAGGTGNVEFEILTGIPLAVLPNYATPYANYLLRPIESLPSLLKRHGYEARAIHNYFSYYYQRFSVYPLLGFDEFISLEDLRPAAISGTLPAEASNLRAIRHISRGDYDALYDGQFPSDEPLVLRVLEQLERPARPGAPQFIFAISMVSHGRYQGQRFPRPEVQILDEALPETARHELENYANALFRADLALGHLLGELAHRARPTVVAFFGDHLPSLTADTYAAAGMDFGRFAKRKYEVPCFIWSNRPLTDIDMPEAFGAHFLGLRILAAAGIEPTGYFARMRELEGDAIALGHARLQAKPGEWFEGVSDPHLPLSARRARDIYFTLAYDRLFGNQFSMVEGGVPEGIEQLGTFEVRVQAPWKQEGDSLASRM